MCIRLKSVLLALAYRDMPVATLRLQLSTLCQENVSTAFLLQG